MEVCRNARHAPIAFSYKGINVQCPLCELLDQLKDAAKLAKECRDLAGQCYEELGYLIEDAL